MSTASPWRSAQWAPELFVVNHGSLDAPRCGFRWNNRNDVGSRGERSPDHWGASPRPTSLSGSLLASGAALSCPGGWIGSGPWSPAGSRAAEGLRGVSRPGRSSPGLPAVGLLGQRRSGGPELEGETDPLCCPLAASRDCRLALSPGGQRGSGWSRPPAASSQHVLGVVTAPQKLACMTTRSSEVPSVCELPGLTPWGTGRS